MGDSCRGLSIKLTRTFLPMKPNITAAIALIALAAIFSGCSSTQTRYGKKEVNVLGIVRVEQASFSEVRPTTISVKTSELVPRPNPSGGRLSFLWGLFTIADD